MKRRLRFGLRSDFGWLPPCLLLLGGREAYRDHSRNLPVKLEGDGLQVEYREYEDQVHVWPLFSELMPEARRRCSSWASRLPQRPKSLSGRWRAASAEIRAGHRVDPACAVQLRKFLGGVCQPDGLLCDDARRRWPSTLADGLRPWRARSHGSPGSSCVLQ